MKNWTDDLRSQLSDLYAAHGKPFTAAGPSTSATAPFSRALPDEMGDGKEEELEAEAAQYNSDLDSVVADLMDIRHIGGGQYVTSLNPPEYVDYVNEAFDLFQDWIDTRAWDKFCSRSR